MLRVCSLGSGSKGNCVYVGNGKTRLLVDMGLSVRRVESGLCAIGVDPKSIDAVLITHSHSDHIKTLFSYLSKYDLPVFAPVGAVSELSRKREAAGFRHKLIEAGAGDFFVGEITVSPIAVSHDVECLAYSFYHSGAKVSVLTDLGSLPEKTVQNVCDSDVVVLEANHDENMLINNPRYSYPLKKRIMSVKGHLSNEASARAALELIRGGVKQIMLAHLSEENNYPELAFKTVTDMLAGFNIIEGVHFKLHVALQNELSAVMDAGESAV